MLLQERYARDPWRVLVACILLNQTSRRQVDAVIEDLFETWPDADHMARAIPDVVCSFIQGLGFGIRRSRTLINMSKRYIELEDPTEEDIARLPGVGPYALDSYRIFYLGDESRFESGDKEIKAYLERTGRGPVEAS